MSMKILSVTLLLLLVSSLSSGNLRHVPKKGSCCKMVKDANIADSVKGDTYTHKPARFPCMEIILLNTDEGQVCVNPKAKWVQNLVANMTEV